MNTATLAPKSIQLISPTQFFARTEVIEKARSEARQKEQMPKLLGRLLRSCAEAIEKPSESQITSLRWEDFMSISPYPRTVQAVKGLTRENQQDLYRQLNWALLESGWRIVPLNGYERSKIIFHDSRTFFLMGPSPLRITNLDATDMCGWRFHTEFSPSYITDFVNNWRQQDRYPDIGEYVGEKLPSTLWPDKTVVVIQEGASSYTTEAYSMIVCHHIQDPDSRRKFSPYLFYVRG